MSVLLVSARSFDGFGESVVELLELGGVGVALLSRPYMGARYMGLLRENCEDLNAASPLSSPSNSSVNRVMSRRTSTNVSRSTAPSGVQIPPSPPRKNLIRSMIHIGNCLICVRS